MEDEVLGEKIGANNMMPKKVLHCQYSLNNISSVNSCGSFRSSSSDGKFIHTYSNDSGECYIWDLPKFDKDHVKTPLCIFDTVCGKQAPTHFSADGEFIATAEGKTIKIWKVSSGICAYTLSGHASDVLYLSFSKKSDYLLSCCGQGKIKIWKTSNGSCYTSFLCTEYEKMLGVVLEENYAVTWFVDPAVLNDNDKKIHGQACDNPTCQGLDQSENNVLEVVQCVLWDFHTNAKVKSFCMCPFSVVKGENENTETPTPTIKYFSNLGKFVVYSLNEAFVWDCNYAIRLGSFKIQEENEVNTSNQGICGTELNYITCCDLSPDGSHLALGTNNGLLSVWSIDKSSISCTLSFYEIYDNNNATISKIESLVFTIDAQYIAVHHANLQTYLWSIRQSVNDNLSTNSYYDDDDDDGDGTDQVSKAVKTGELIHLRGLVSAGLVSLTALKMIVDEGVPSFVVIGSSLKDFPKIWVYDDEIIEAAEKDISDDHKSKFNNAANNSNDNIINGNYNENELEEDSLEISGSSQYTSSEDEDKESKLKYERLDGSLKDIFKDHSATAMTAHERFLAIGTNTGTVFITDFSGNEIMRFRAHTKKINGLCMDNNGDFVASCSDDGTVVINGFYDTENNTTISNNRPVNDCQLSPNFKRPTERKVLHGGSDGQLLLTEKGWFGNKSRTLGSGEGAIYAIAWKGIFIAWANDVGVMIWDVTLNQKISFINRPPDSPPPYVFRCNLCWADEKTILVGWADSVKVAVVKERPQTWRRERSTSTSNPLPPKRVEIISMFRTDYWICGIGPYENDLCILAFVPQDEDDEEVNESNAPELCVVSYKNEEVCCDALPISDFERYSHSDYRFASLPSEKLFFVVSPQEIVVAKPRDENDHIKWLIQRSLFEEALDAAEEGYVNKLVPEQIVLEVGLQYIAHLLENKNFNDAAALCPRVLKEDRAKWQTWVYAFANAKRLKAISDYVPVSNPRLEPTTYELILKNYLYSREYEGFLKLIERWPSEIYSIPTIIAIIFDQQRKDPSATCLTKALAELYAYNKQYDEALHIYLQLRSGDIFKLIHKHDLFTSVKQDLVLLMEFDSSKAVKLLLDNMDRIPLGIAVKQLTPRPEFLHLYLSSLFDTDTSLGQKYHELQVELYAKFDYKKLMSFLRQSNYYHLEKALNTCESYNLVPEMVYLLGKIGDNKKALNLIIGKLGDVDMAIDFAKEQNDEELWEDLITYSMDKPAFIRGLLNNIGTHVDPIVLIKRIPHGLKIPGLKESLIKIMQDFHLQVSLREGCEKILVSDSTNLFQRLYETQRKGICIQENAVCELCNCSLVRAQKDPTYVFFCRHAYHLECLTGRNISGTSQFRKESINENGGMLDIFCPLCQNIDKHRKSKQIKANGLQI